MRARNIPVLARSALVLASGRIVAAASMAALYGFSARALTLSEFGALTTAVSVCAIAIALADGGLNLMTVRELAGLESSNAKTLTEHVSTRMTIALTVTGLTAVFLAFAAVGDHRVLIALSPLGIWVALEHVATSLLTLPLAQGRTHVVSATVAGGRVVAVLVAIFLLESGLGLPAATLALACGSGTGLAISYALLPFRLRIRLASIAEVGRQIAAARHFLSAAIAPQLQSFDVVIISVLLGSSSAGIYGAPSRLLQPLGLLNASVSEVLLPHLRRQTPSARRITARRIRNYLLPTAALGYGLLAVIGPSAVKRALGDEYAESGPILRIFALGLFLSTLNMVYVKVLQADGSERSVARSLVVAVPAGLLTTAALAQFHGLPWAAFGVIVVQACSFIGLHYSERRTVNQ